jgi:hypothetical protein
MAEKKEAAEAQHEGRADGEPTNVGVGQVQWRLGQHQQRTGHDQVVALDEADEGENGDDQDVVAAERDAVELAPENIAGGYCRSDRRANFCHGDLPRSSNPREPRGNRAGRRPALRFYSGVSGFCELQLCRRLTDFSSRTVRHRVDVLLIFQSGDDLFSLTSFD